MSTYDELLAIYSKHQALTPPLVVDEARPEGHPLHDRFEWDDTVAGERYRHVQAAELIRVQRVIYAPSRDGEERSVRRFHSVPTINGPTYRPTTEIVDDPIAYDVLLAELQRAWRNLQRQYGHLKEFAEIVRGDEAA